MEKNREPVKKRVLKRKILKVEFYSSCIIYFVLFAIIFWFFSRRDSYSPEERDISYNMLKGDKKLELYKSPLKNFSETGKIDGSVEIKKVALGIFPKSILSGSWKVNSRVKYFTPENLYVKINGEAIKFLEQGFKSMRYIVIGNKKGKEEISIELYDQGDRKGSMGLFSEYISGDKKVKQSGSSTYISTSAGAIGRKGPFFYRISGNFENRKIRSKSNQIARALAGLPGRKKTVSIAFRMLNSGMKIDSRGIEYKGSNVFQFDFAKDFWFGKIDPQKPGRLFIHYDKGTAITKNLFKMIVTNQAMDYQMLEQKENFVLMRHSYLKTYFAIKYRGSFIYGISNKKDKNDISMIMDKFAAVLVK